MQKALVRIGLFCGIALSFPVSAFALTNISNCTQLQDMDTNLAENYVLTADIDCTGVSFTRIGDDDTAFTGTLDGNGHSISNLTISNGSTRATGLFGATNGATLREFRIINATVTGGSASGILGGEISASTVTEIGVEDFHFTGNGNNVGGVIGYSSNNTISKVYAFSGSVAAASRFTVGGFTGLFDGGTITDIYVKSVTVTGNEDVGGIGGYLSSGNYNVSLTNAYAEATVTGNTRAAGAFGRLLAGNTCTMTNVFSTSTVSASSNPGGLVGGKESGCTITNSAYNNTGSPSACVGTDSNSATTSCTSQSSNASFFYDSDNAPLLSWDFSGSDAVWRQSLGATPVLAWESDATAPTIVRLTPADDAINVALTPSLTIVFSESVKGITGNITVFQDDGSTLSTITVTSSQVTGSGSKTISISPGVTFTELTSAYVQIATTAFKDLKNNSFAGITNASTWNFRIRNLGGGSAHTAIRLRYTEIAAGLHGSADNRNDTEAPDLRDVGIFQSGTGALLPKIKDNEAMVPTNVHNGYTVSRATQRMMRVASSFLSSGQRAVPPTLVQTGTEKEAETVPEDTLSPFEERVCARVLPRFTGNALQRVNERLENRLGFVCEE